MFYSLDKDTIKKEVMINIETDQDYLCLLSYKELEENRAALGISSQVIIEYRRGITKFESHDGFDLIALNIPCEINKNNKQQKVFIYYRPRLLAFVCDDDRFLSEMFSQLEVEGLKDISLGKVLYHFFERLTSDDAFLLEKIEKEITELEEVLIVAERKNFSDTLVNLRKRLLTLKVYYEQLWEIAEEIEQNENELIEAKILRYFRIFTGRTERLYHNVLNLRDYVTQVREAYQAQMDIRLNRIMEVFTVIAAIFLPLTLIVGWYGMNLKMPEYNWDYGYIFVIGLCLLTLFASIFFIKRNKWF